MNIVRMPPWRANLARAVHQDGRALKQISIAADLGETFVRDVLKRGRVPSLENVIVLARVLGTSVSAIVSEGGS